jgi:hypothetical protein
MGHVSSSSGRFSRAAFRGTSCLPQRVHRTKVSGSVGTSLPRTGARSSRLRDRFVRE